MKGDIIWVSFLSGANGSPSNNHDIKGPLVVWFSMRVVIHFSPLAAFYVRVLQRTLITTLRPVFSRFSQIIDLKYVVKIYDHPDHVFSITGVWKIVSNRFLDEPWWYGEINRQGRGSVRGLFPSNYITVTDQVRQRYRIRTPTGMVQNRNFTKKFWLSKS